MAIKLLIVGLVSLGLLVAISALEAWVARRMMTYFEQRKREDA